MGKGFHFDKDDLDFMKDVMEHSDGSERKIGDFVIRNDYGANLYYEGNGGDVIIPEEVGSAGRSFTFKSERANNIRSLEYPSCIECIWADEIVPMRNSLEKIVFHEGLGRILGAGAFANFMKLKDVKLPKSLCYLGSNAFKNTPWYKEHVEIVDGCHYIERFLVSSDKDIVNANVREGTVMICGHAFRDRESLLSVELPDTVRTLGEQAFCGCRKLKKISLPSSVEVIENSCFTGCVSMEFFEALNPNIEVAPSILGSKTSDYIYYPKYAYIPTTIEDDAFQKDSVKKLIFAYCYLTSRERYSPEKQAINDKIVKKMKSKLLELIIEQKNEIALTNIVSLVIKGNGFNNLIKLEEEKGNAAGVEFLKKWKDKES